MFVCVFCIAAAAEAMASRELLKGGLPGTRRETFQNPLVLHAVLAARYLQLQQLLRSLRLTKKLQSLELPPMQPVADS